MNVQDQVNSAIQSTIMTTGIIIAVCVVVSIAILVVARRYIGRATGADLRTGGIAAQARILKLWDTGASINDNPVAGLLLEVQRPGQPTYQVETKSLIPRLAVGQIQPGAVVGVKIDPANTQRVVLDLYAA